MDGVLGLSFHFIDSNMVVVTIADALLKINKSHSAANVADKLLKICQDRFGIDLQAVASGGASDTANAARAVQSVLGINQNNCTMHVVSLVLSYVIGMRENYKTEKSVDKMGNKTKVQLITSPGGAFPFGAKIIQSLKEIANYFSKLPQCKEDFKKTKKGALLEYCHTSHSSKQPSSTISLCCYMPCRQKMAHS